MILLDMPGPILEFNSFQFCLVEEDFAMTRLCIGYLENSLSLLTICKT